MNDYVDISSLIEAVRIGSDDPKRVYEHNAWIEQKATKYDAATRLLVFLEPLDALRVAADLKWGGESGQHRKAEIIAKYTR